MLDLGWQEFVMIGLVLVLVVGPKDMPRVMRSVARYMAKARSMARDFQNSMLEVAEQSDLKEVQKALQDAKSEHFDGLAQDLGAVQESLQDSLGASVAEAAHEANTPPEKTKKIRAKAVQKTTAKKAPPKASKKKTAKKT